MTKRQGERLDSRLSRSGVLTPPANLPRLDGGDAVTFVHRHLDLLAARSLTFTRRNFAGLRRERRENDACHKSGAEEGNGEEAGHGLAGYLDGPGLRPGRLLNAFELIRFLAHDCNESHMEAREGRDLVSSGPDN